MVLPILGLQQDGGIDFAEFPNGLIKVVSECRFVRHWMGCDVVFHPQCSVPQPVDNGGTQASFRQIVSPKHIEIVFDKDIDGLRLG